MEEIKNKIEEMMKVVEHKEKIDELGNGVKDKEKELEQLNKEFQLSMIGTVDREMKKEEVDKASKELEEITKEKEEQQKNLNEEFGNVRTDLVSSIDKEMEKYKRKSELEELESKKKAYEKIAENAQKTIDKAIESFNKGEKINQAILDNAREELKVNKEKEDELEHKIEGCKELEANLEEYKDLEYLKTRVQGLKITQINKNLESDFVNKYFKKEEKELENLNKDQENVQNNKKEANNVKTDLAKEEVKEQGDKIISDLGKDYKNVSFDPMPISNVKVNLNDNEQTKEQSETNPEEVKEQGNEIIKDLENDYKNVHFTPEPLEDNEEKIDDEKNISIFISENDKIIKCKNENGTINIPIETLIDEKNDMYKRLRIGKICRKVIKETTGKRRLGLMLKRKVNPEVIRALDSIGNKDLIGKYIESIYNKDEFPFGLKHDLSGLSIGQRFKLRKYIKVEEKCGAEILGKIWNKNKTLNPGVQDIDEIQKENKNEIAENINEILEKENKEKVSFVQKVDGKNEEVAKKHKNSRDLDNYENIPLEELLNASDISQTSKDVIADYANKYGIKEAKRRYEKALLPARVKLSFRETVQQAREERKPGNQQIKNDIQKNDDEGR